MLVELGWDEETILFITGVPPHQQPTEGTQQTCTEDETEKLDLWSRQQQPYNGNHSKQ